MRQFYKKILFILILTPFHLLTLGGPILDRYESGYGLVYTTLRGSNNPTGYTYLWCDFDKELNTATMYFDIKEGQPSINDPYFNNGFTKILIPATVKYNNKTYAVTKLVGAQPIHKIYNMVKIISFEYAENLEVIDGTFSDWEMLEGVDFGKVAKIKKIGKHSFFNCKSLRFIEGDLRYLEDIGESAFYGCPLLNFSLSSPLSKLRFIGEGAFAGCSSLRDFPLGDSKLYISTGAFKNCSSLNELRLKEIDYIGPKAFEGCKNLSIEINGPLEHTAFTPSIKFAEYAFQGFDGRDINFNNVAIIKIPPKTFYECYAQNVNFNESRLHSLEEEAFMYSTCNVDLSQIDHASTYFELGTSCFEGASGKVNMPKDFNSMSKFLRERAFYKYSYPDFEVTEEFTWGWIPSLSYASSSIKKFKTTAEGVSFHETVFSNCKSLEYFEIDNKLHIVRYALPPGLLANTPNLKKFIVPGLQVLSSQLFANSGIENIDLSLGKLHTIENEVFIGSKLKNIDLSKNSNENKNASNTLSLGKDIFKNCNFLDSINLSFAGISEEINDSTLFHFRHINLLGNKMEKITLYNGFEHLILPCNEYYDESEKKWRKPNTKNYVLALPEDQIRTKSVVIECGTLQNGIPALLADEKSIENWNKNNLPAYLYVDDADIEEYQKDPGYSACFTILPLSKGPGVITLSEEEKTLKMGEYYMLKADFNEKGVYDMQVEWAIDNPEIASIETIPDENNAIMVKGLKTGKAIVTCSTIGSSTKGWYKNSATCIINVNTLTLDDIPVIKLEFEEEEVLIPSEIPAKLKLKVLPENHTETLKWESSNFHAGLGIGIEVDQNGVVTEHGGFPQSAKITVSSANCSAVCNVQSNSRVQEFFFDTDTITIMRNDIATLKVTSTLPELYYDSAEFEWRKSLLFNSIEILEISDDTKSITFKGINVGEGTIKATCKIGWNGRDAKINVIKENVRSFELSATEEDIWLNESGTLEITSVNPDDFTSPKFSWTVDDDNIEITDISPDKKSISFIAKKVGRCEITARSLDNDTVYATCKINVLEKTVKNFELSERSLYLYPEEVAEISVRNIVPDIFVDSEFDWFTDNSNVVITDTSADTQTITLEAKSEGLTTITARSLVNPNVTAICEVYVSIPFIAPPILEGDANGDEKLDIADVVMTIKYILTPEELGEIPSHLDLNNDGKINIADVTKLIKLIFDQQTTRSISNGVDKENELTGRLQYNNVELITDQQFEIPVSLDANNDLVGLQADIITSGNVFIEDIVSCNNHVVEWKRIEENKVRLIMYDMKNEVISQATPILSLKIRNLSDLNGSLFITEIIGADKEATAYGLASDVITLDSASIGLIDKKSASINIDGNKLNIYNAEGKEVNIYNMSGIAIKSFVSPSDYEEIKLESGIYIVKINNIINKIVIK